MIYFRRLEELESLLERVDHNSKAHIEELTAKVHTKSSEASSLSLENERLKVCIGERREIVLSLTKLVSTLMSNLWERFILLKCLPCQLKKCIGYIFVVCLIDFDVISTMQVNI
jgi:hypothetical protein